MGNRFPERRIDGAEGALLHSQQINMLHVELGNAITAFRLEPIGLSEPVIRFLRLQYRCKFAAAWTSPNKMDI
jgi:hypothetical protein